MCFIQEKSMIEMRIVRFLLLAVCFLLSAVPSSVRASVDDVSVLSHVNRDTDVKQFLKEYPFHRWEGDRGYSGFHRIYITEDKGLMAQVWGSRITSLLLIGPSYATDKGIHAGDTLSEVEEAYGPVYSYGHEEEKGTGTIYRVPAGGSLGEGYYAVRYVTDRGEELSFLFNPSGVIVLTRYEAQFRPDQPIEHDVETCHLTF
jgi:hypothetical protein